MTRKNIWISWEDHRRSRELSSSLGVDFAPIVYEAPRWKRYPVLLLRTVLLLLKRRPDTVFVQNPSIVLTSCVVLLRGIFRYVVVVDRHSNFKFENEHSKIFKWRLFHFLSKYTLRGSDLTVVTNDPLKTICEDYGGRAVVLQDKIPSMDEYSKEEVPTFIEDDRELFHVMAVTTFSEDEPIDEIIEAAKRLPDRFRLYLTGSYRKHFSDEDKRSLESFGVIFTGFIDESDYQTLMCKANAVIVLTKKEFVLNCGAYEAIAFGKPMILSSTNTIRGYFDFGAVYSSGSAEDIYSCILKVEAEEVGLRKQLESGVIKLNADWDERFLGFKRTLQELDVQV